MHLVGSRRLCPIALRMHAGGTFIVDGFLRFRIGLAAEEWAAREAVRLVQPDELGASRQ